MPDQASIGRARKLEPWTEALGWVAEREWAAEKAVMGHGHLECYGTFN